MKRYLFLLLALFCTGPSWAHNAKIASYTLRDTGAGWIIEINFAQAGLLASLESDLGELSLTELNPEKLKSLIIEKVQHNFLLTVDGVDVTLENGGILMGNHQTNFKFVLPEIPANPRQMQISIPMCSEVYNHTNIFRIYRGGANVSKVFLSEDNDFQADLQWSNGELVVSTELAEASASLGFLEGGLATLLVILVVIGWFRLRKFT